MKVLSKHLINIGVECPLSVHCAHLHHRVPPLEMLPEVRVEHRVVVGGLDLHRDVDTPIDTIDRIKHCEV